MRVSDALDEAELGYGQARLQHINQKVEQGLELTGLEKAMLNYEQNKHLYENETNEQWCERQAKRYNEKEGELAGYDCKACKNRGNFEVVVEGMPAIRECECMKVRRALRLLKNSGLEQAVREKTFESFVCENELQKTMKNKAQSWLQSQNKWLMFSGQSGVGKTHLCTAVCGVLLKNGVEVVYMTYRDDIPKIKRHATDDGEYNKLMDKWQECEVLYIDDLFKGKTTDADISILFELIDYRNRNNLRTIISTELSPAELMAKDEALGGRIIHKCGEFVIVIPKNARHNYRARAFAKPEPNNENTKLGKQSPRLPYKDD